MLRGDDAEYQRRYHTLGSSTRRLSNPDMEAFAKLHKGGDVEHQRNKYPPQHAATLVNTNCARQQVTRVCVWMFVGLCIFSFCVKSCKADGENNVLLCVWVCQQSREC